MLKFALITDIHYGVDKGWKLGTQARSLMSDFIQAVNNYQADFTAALGDFVNSRNHKSDTACLRELKTHFNQAAAPVYPILGNNEVRHMTREEYAKILETTPQSYTRDVKDYRFAFWNPEVNTDGTDGLSLTEEDIQWLQKTLDESDKPVILFSHVPLCNREWDDVSATVRDRSANRSYYPQGAKIREMMEQSGKVVMCMAGHKHHNRHREINGIHYVTHQSFSQSLDGKTPTGAYSFVEIENRDVRIKGFGVKQPSLQFKLGA